MHWLARSATKRLARTWRQHSWHRGNGPAMSRMGHLTMRRAGTWPQPSMAYGKGRLDVELDALGQRQRIRIIDRVGLPTHVHLPGIGPGFTAAAGFLLAAER